MSDYDLLVIGGGVNGAGIARDAAGRGLSVALVEREDLAQHTSSASTKLIHGGLRYLESYDFRLVRESLQEREVLLGVAPHIMWPLRFVLPYHKGLRPAWLLRLGLFLYDHIGGRTSLAKTGVTHFDRPPLRGQLQDSYIKGFVYSDAWVEDARLVALNAVGAHRRGADVMTRTEVLALRREGSGADAVWRVMIGRPGGGASTVLRARAVVNAAGPWVSQMDAAAGAGHSAGTRLVKGSHIVTHRLYHGNHAYIFQQSDGRVVFAIPYEGNYTLIGTTDVAVEDVDAPPKITEEETRYLCDAVSAYFRTPVSPEDVIWSYAGVRPLFDDQSQNASKVTRDYRLLLDDDGAPLLSVYGGKLTTYRRLAEQAVDMLRPWFSDMDAPWTRRSALPGGGFKGRSFREMLAQAARDYPWMDGHVLSRMLHYYGTDIKLILEDALHIDDLGYHFGAGLYEREVRYLIEFEFARSPDDILWRRTKLGLHLNKKEQFILGEWFSQQAEKAAS